MQKKNSVAKAIDTLKRINSSLEASPRFVERYTYAGHALWASKQFFLFWKIKEFLNKSVDPGSQVSEGGENLRSSLVSKFLRRLTILGISAVGLCKLFLFRPAVILYEADRLVTASRYGQRLPLIQKTLDDIHVPFFEFVHTIPDISVIKNAWQRKRIVFYIEAIDIVYRMFLVRRSRSVAAQYMSDIGLDAFEESESDFIRNLLSEYLEYLELVRFRSAVLRTLFRVYQRVCRGRAIYVSIDDMRFVDELVSACQQASIPTYVIQHSNFDYLYGLDHVNPRLHVFPDHFLFWSQFWVNRITRVSPLYAAYADRCSVGGRAYAYVQRESRVQMEKSEQIRVVIPYEGAVSESDLKPYMEALLSDSRIEVALVVRGDLDKGVQAKKYMPQLEELQKRLVVVDPSGKIDALKRADVVIGVYSGFLDEAVESHIPVVVPKTQYVTTTSLLGDQLADALSLDGEPLYDQLARARNQEHSVLQDRSRRISEGTGNIVTSIQAILKTHHILQ